MIIWRLTSPGTFADKHVIYGSVLSSRLDFIRPLQIVDYHHPICIFGRKECLHSDWSIDTRGARIITPLPLYDITLRKAFQGPVIISTFVRRVALI